MSERKPEYYVLTPVYPPPPGTLMNASVGLCGLCSAVTTGMGGGSDQICVRCADLVMQHRARGSIVWEEKE